MASDDVCPICGFKWDSITSADVAPRLDVSSDNFAQVLEGAGELVDVRPSPDRWSILEYGSHLRDVFLSIRERMILAAVLDEPTGNAIYREERVNLGLYALDTASVVASELRMSARLLARTFAALPDGYQERTLIYSPVTPKHVTILWLTAQAIHECEHHLDDTRENLKLLLS